MNFFKSILYIVTLSILFACGDERDEENNKPIDKNEVGHVERKELSVNGFKSWSNKQDENVLVKKKKIKEFNYTLKYLPIDLMVLKELKGEIVSQQKMDSLRKDYEGMEYFELRIQIDDYNDEPAKYMLDNPTDYQTRIAYMAFTMQNDLMLVTETNKEVSCRLFHFERTYSVAPYCTFLMGFSKEEIGDEMGKTVVYNDNLFNKGLIKFNWTSATLNNLPKIEAL